MLSVESLLGDEQEAGIYSWLLDRDRLYGDTFIALLFGLDPSLTVKGLPIASFLQRVHPDDQAFLSRSITDAVKGGHTYHAEYRVKNAVGQYTPVMAMGRCYRDDIGNPLLYTGIIYPVELLE